MDVRKTFDSSDQTASDNSATARCIEFHGAGRWARLSPRHFACIVTAVLITGYCRMHSATSIVGTPADAMHE